MGKAEIGTAKYAAKQLKAAGLQKLRYYCQVCSKQCRDQNGFKNHIQSETHLNNINATTNDSINEFSNTFLKDFLKLLRINHGTKKISSNKFYQEYILNDRNHVHMNSTRWSSLSQFVYYLGDKGLVTVEDTENDGLCITYLDNSPEAIERQEQLKKKSKSLKSDEELSLKLIQDQIKQGKKQQLKELQEEEQEESKSFKTLKESTNLKPIKISFKKETNSTTDMKDNSGSNSKAKPSSETSNSGVDERSYTKPIMKCGISILPHKAVPPSKDQLTLTKISKQLKPNLRNQPLKKNAFEDSDDEEGEDQAPKKKESVASKIIERDIEYKKRRTTK